TGDHPPGEQSGHVPASDTPGRPLGSSHSHSHSHSPGAMRWGPAAIGLAIYSLVGGIALASAVAADFDVGRGALGAGLGVFIATLVHKPADALTITALMIESGAPR